MTRLRTKQVLITSVAFAALVVSTHFVGKHASSPFLLAYWIIGAAVIASASPPTSWGDGPPI